MSVRAFKRLKSVKTERIRRQGQARTEEIGHLFLRSDKDGKVRQFGCHLVKGKANLSNALQMRLMGMVIHTTGFLGQFLQMI